MAQFDFNSYVTSGTKEQFLIISSREFAWLEPLREASELLTILESEAGLLSTLASNRYDVVFIDVVAIDMKIASLLSEVQYRFPDTRTSVIVEDADRTQQEEIFASGADDVILSSISVDAFLNRLQLLLRHQRKNQEFWRRSKTLHAISILSQQLHNAEHPMSLIVETINAVCSDFDVDGMAITIDRGGIFHLYAGSNDINNRRRLYESSVRPHRYDPLYHVIASEIYLVCKDISKHPYYTAIPVIDDPRSAIIMPLKYGDQILGSMALFSSGSNLTSEDLAPYELLATHFASAYYNVRHYYDREVAAHSTRQTLRAWQTLTVLYDVEAIAQTLYNLIKEIQAVKETVVWLFKPQDESQVIIVHTDDMHVMELVEQMFEQGHLDQLMSEFDVTMQPITFHQRHIKQSALVDLFTLMQISQVTLVPVAGNMILGGIFVATDSNQALVPNDMNLIESLAHAAAQALERNTLIRSLQEQSGRLEAVLRSIREGIVFVNESGKVIFCNPQFTELTTISPSQVIGKPHNQLFYMLAKNSARYDTTLEQLNQSLEQILSASEDTEEYPVIEIRQALLDIDLYMEFMRINSDQDQGGWIGFIRDRKQGTMLEVSTNNLELASEIVEEVGLQMLELQKMVLMLPEQQDLLSPRKYVQQLSRVEEQVEDAQIMWGNFLQIFQSELSGMQIRPTITDPVEFLEDVLTSRRMDKYHRRQIRLTSQPPRLRVMIDERPMRQVITNIINFLTHYTPSAAPIFVNVVPEGSQVVISFQEKITILPEDMLASILDPLNEEDEDSDGRSYRLGMYLSKHIIKAHDGKITVESRRGWGTMVKVHLPIEEATEAVALADEQTTTSISSRTTRPEGLTVVVLESAERLLEAHYDALAEHNHELLIEERVDDALINLSLAQIDLIIVEASQSQPNIVEICRLIRQKTEVPIMIIASADMEGACIRALSNGADDYTLTPINRERLVAQMQSIAMRKDISSRTAPPIQIGNLHIDLSRRRVYLGDRLLDLTAKEYELLRVLASHENQVLTHQQLLTRIWGPEYQQEKQYLWVNISRLRRKLEPTKDSPRYLQTEQGIGYVLREP